MKIINILWCMLFLHATALNGFWCCKTKETDTTSTKGRASTQLSTLRESKGTKRDLVIDTEVSASATPPKQMAARPAVVGNDSPSSNSDEQSFNTKKFIQEIERDHEGLLQGKTTLDIRANDPAMPTLKALTDRFLTHVVTAAHQRDASVDDLNALHTRFVQYKCLITHEELSGQRDSFFEVSQFDSQAGSRQTTPGGTPRPQALGGRHRFTISSLTRPNTDAARKPSDDNEEDQGV